MVIKQLLLDVIRRDIANCNVCSLHQNRTNTVPGEGSAGATLVFVGEGPGENEDKQGRPFVGRSGKLLDLMISRMSLCREDVHILNICKCRPPNNRAPNIDEIRACLPYLYMQLKIIEPKVIVTLGATATVTLLGNGESISKRRGRICSLDIEGKQIVVIPTFHPAYLLRNPTAKSLVAQDLATVRKLI